MSQNNDLTTQVWLDYNPNTKLNDKLTLKMPIGGRAAFPNEWYRFYISPSIYYDWPRMIFKDLKYKEQLIGGASFYYTDNVQGVNNMEIRGVQGYSLSAPNRMRLVIKHYIRLEERFQIDTEDWNNTFGLRFRYKAALIFKFQGDLWKFGKGSYLPMDVEFFWDLIGSKQFNDKFRFNFGLGRQFNKAWKAALTMGYHYTRNSTSDSFHSSDIIFRFRVYHTI